MSYFAFFKEVGDCNVFEFQTLQERDEWLVDDLTVLTKLPMVDKRVIDEVLHGSARDNGDEYEAVVDELNPRQIDHIRRFCRFIFPKD